MIRVGVVGAGTMGQHHARIYAELGAKLVGIADLDLPQAEAIAKKYNTRPFPDYRELISRVDAVSIAVPTSLHRQVALDFIRQGVHCLVEKPIASTSDEGRDIVQQAKQNQAKLMVGHIERFNPAVTRLKEIIDQGVLGELMIISTRRVGPFVPRIRDVGILLDIGSHDIDVARYLIGKEPVNFFCKAGKFKHQKEDHAVLVLDFGKTMASIEVNWFTPHKVRSLVATGSKGIAYLDYIEQSLVVHTGPEDTKVIEIQKAEPLKLELAHFLGCIENGRQPLVDGEDGLRTLQIALQAGQVVSYV